MVGCTGIYRNIASKYVCTAYTYDFLDRVLSTTMSNERGTVLSYEECEYEIVLFENKASEKVTTSVYDGDVVVSREIEYLDAMGNLFAKETEFAPTQFYSDRYYYDSYGRMTSSEGDTQVKATNVYDRFNNIIEVQYQDGSSEKFTFDGFGRILTTTNKTGNTTAYTYDKSGNVIHSKTLFSESDDNKYYKEQWDNYDLYGNLIESEVTTNKPGEAKSVSVTKYQYDVNDNLILVEEKLDDQNSRHTQYTYDLNGSLLKALTGLSEPISIVDGQYEENPQFLVLNTVMTNTVT